ncbi:MAG: DUF2752 domain-containing protein, partial [Candidatus Eisenbacteria bacterium]
MKFAPVTTGSARPVAGIPARGAGPLTVSTRSRVPWIAPIRLTSWLVWSLAGAAGGVGWSALAARAHALGMDSVCLLRQVAHVACPTCGMTRALALLAAGDWRSALAL